VLTDASVEHKDDGGHMQADADGRPSASQETDDNLLHNRLRFLINYYVYLSLFAHFSCQFVKC